MKNPLYVTRPFLPPLEEFTSLLPLLWENRILTNGGIYHNQLEEELAKTANVGCCSLMNNGTIALLIALKAMNLTGEVITTPFSFVATSHVLLWLGLEPVFVDIDPETLNISPNSIEAAITSKTSAILGVHCYGTSCDTQAIKKIADNNSISVIYDAAHAFGVTDDGGSILRHGDVSVVSFHATKVFHTIEGGAIFTENEELNETFKRLRNFGIKDDMEVSALGLNAKLNELSCAMGLVNLRHFQSALSGREIINNYYQTNLEANNHIRFPKNSNAKVKNFSYFPILVNSSEKYNRDGLYDFLRQKNIFTRKYFYPLICDQNNYKEARKLPLPVAKAAASEILCLPIFPEMKLKDAVDVVEHINMYFQ